jgi:hypothetical protein
MKISAAQITKGMQIKVSEVHDMKSFYTQAINGNYYSETEKSEMQKLIDEEKTKVVRLGSVNKNSEIYTILGIQFCSSLSQYHNRKLVTNNNIWLITDKGNLQIQNKQKVELI